MKVLYTAEATAWGGRNGRAASTDGNLDVMLVTPKELGGPGTGGTNPEQLFAAGYAGCFHNALILVAKGSGQSVEGSAVTARVGLGPADSGGFGLTVELLVEVPGMEADLAEDLVAKAHEVCPYSNATRGNVDVTVSLVD